jgi:hypothetical protein
MGRHEPRWPGESSANTCQELRVLRGLEMGADIGAGPLVVAASPICNGIISYDLCDALLH